MKTDWNPLLKTELAKPYWDQLQRFVHDERQKHTVYPPADEVFAALHLTPFSDTRVVVLGQDPYHGPGQAHGLCFSVRPPTPPPPSLKNIFAELENDLGVPPPSHGSLVAWARQGVLLLNTSLTVRSGEAASHQGKGWETFTDAILTSVNNKDTPVIFVLWGASARKKRSLIDTSKHAIVESAHPSPLSAHRGFLGSRPFSQINKALASTDGQPIDWALG